MLGIVSGSFGDCFYRIADPVIPAYDRQGSLASCPDTVINLKKIGLCEYAIHSSVGEDAEMLIRVMVIMAMLNMSGVTAAWAEQTPAPSNAKLYIIWPPDGAVIKGGKLWVRMGLRNAGVAPKGVEMANVGHHHLLIDTDLPPLDQEIPSDRNHIHFGGGQTEARVEDLSPGEHTLQLLLGDDNHVPHDPPIYSKKITITVPPY